MVRMGPDGRVKDVTQVLTEERGHFPYDYLVLAAGATTNTFGIPGVEEHSFPLKSMPDALVLRAHLLRQFELADNDPGEIDKGAIRQKVSMPKNAVTEFGGLEVSTSSTQLQALFGYNSSLAEFDRATGAQSTYTESFDNLAPRATRSKTYDTSSGMDAVGEHKKSSAPGVLPNPRATPTSK